MTPAAAVGRALVAARIVRFYEEGGTLTIGNGPGGAVRVLDDSGLVWEWAHREGWVLVTDHPATAGVLVRMLAATGRLNAIGAPNDGETTWDVQLRDPPSWTTFSGDTLAEAAGRALLAVKGGSP